MVQMVMQGSYLESFTMNTQKYVKKIADVHLSIYVWRNVQNQREKAYN